MNKFNYLLIFCLFFGLETFAQTKVKSRDVVAESCRIVWTGFKPLGEHKGEISVKDGQMEFSGDTLVGGVVTIDMASLTCTDITDQAKNGKLVGHLKSADFFNVVEHSTASLKIKKAVPYGTFDTGSDESTGELYKIVADVTIKGITKEVKFKTNLYRYLANQDYVSLVARTTIDRSDFDVQYGSGSFFNNIGDQLIYDEFDLSVSLTVKNSNFK